MRFAPSAIFVTAAISAASAVIMPQDPWEKSVWKAGSQHDVTWDTDSTGTWKSMKIEFMTGADQDMIWVADIANDIDATTVSSVPWMLPAALAPYGTIYFLQFTNNETGDKTWTSRFTIESSDGTAAPTPANPIQPGTSATIGWGIGALGTVAPDQTSIPANQGRGSSTSGPGAAATATASATGASASLSPEKIVIVTVHQQSASVSASGSTAAAAKVAASASTEPTSGDLGQGASGLAVLVVVAMLGAALVV